jgi:hypothetical protein
MTRQRRLVLGFLLAFTIAGFYLGYVVSRGMDTTIALVVPGILLTLLAFAWCREDALQHGRHFATWVKLLVVLVAPFGFLVYVFTSYPWSRAVRTSLLGFAVAASGGVLFIGSIALTDLFGI